MWTLQFPLSGLTRSSEYTCSLVPFKRTVETNHYEKYNFSFLFLLYCFFTQKSSYGCHNPLLPIVISRTRFITWSIIPGVHFWNRGPYMGERKENESRLERGRRVRKRLIQNYGRLNPSSVLYFSLAKSLLWPCQCWTTLASCTCFY